MKHIQDDTAENNTSRWMACISLAHAALMLLTNTANWKSVECHSPTFSPNDYIAHILQTLVYSLTLPFAVSVWPDFESELFTLSVIQVTSGIMQAPTQKKTAEQWAHVYVDASVTSVPYTDFQGGGECGIVPCFQPLSLCLGINPMPVCVSTELIL